MSIQQTPHEWSVDSLINKAQRFAETMQEKERDSWQFGFWSALTLELLARASLSKISPSLLADAKDWNNIYYSLGYQPNVKKFSPKSVTITDVLKRLEILLPSFTPELHSFCLIHFNRRNEEVHSGGLPFDGLGTSKWLSKYFLVSKILLESLDKNLEFLFGVEEEQLALELIKASEDKASKAVVGTIKAHSTVWQEKTQVEQETLRKQAETIASRKYGHRVNCPACGSIALLHGNAIGEAKTTLEEDIVVEKQTLLPSHFECFACNLKITGFSKLNSCGLGDSFTDTSHYDPIEYFEIEPSEEHFYEPDFNE